MQLVEIMDGSCFFDRPLRRRTVIRFVFFHEQCHKNTLLQYCVRSDQGVHKISLNQLIMHLIATTDLPQHQLKVSDGIWIISERVANIFRFFREETFLSVKPLKFLLQFKVFSHLKDYK